MNNISAPPTSVRLAKDSLVVGEGSSLLAVAGEGVVLECKAEGGNPPPALRWSVGGSARDGAEEEIDPETGVTTSRLVLRVVRSDQGREVTCEAAHPALQHVLLATARLQVQCESEIEPLQKTNISPLTIYRCTPGLCLSCRSLLRRGGHSGAHLRCGLGALGQRALVSSWLRPHHVPPALAEVGPGDQGAGWRVRLQRQQQCWDESARQREHRCAM